MPLIASLRGIIGIFIFLVAVYLHLYSDQTDLYSGTPSSRLTPLVYTLDLRESEKTLASQLLYSNISPPRGVLVVVMKNIALLCSLFASHPYSSPRLNRLLTP
jgi:hypothetical protein